MPAHSHRFQLGNFECVALYDGNFNYPPEVFYVNAVLEELEDILHQQGLPVDRIPTPYSCLLVDSGAERVMVDTGAGNLAAHAETMFPGIDHSTTTTGDLVQSLRTTGIEPGKIDTVIITHAHPDHIGGTSDESGNLVFANAQDFMSCP